MNNIHFSPESIRDLQDTKAYITNELCSEQAAKSTIDKILQTIRSLEVFPQIGTPLSSIVDLETSYRFLVCGNHVAFYRLEGDDVYIVRILYGRRNFMQILFGESEEK